MRMSIVMSLRRAKKFNLAQWRTRIYETGDLSEGEKIHIEMVEKIINQRIQSLVNARRAIRKVLEP
jgi:hypothetical protein